MYMPYFSSLPEDAGVRHILSLNPAAGRTLIEFHQAALRNALVLLPRDYELLSAALGECTVMSLRMYAQRKQWPLENTHVTLSHARSTPPTARTARRRPARWTESSASSNWQGRWTTGSVLA